MTETGDEAPRGNFLPPTPAAAAGIDAAREAAAAHAHTPRHGRRPPPPHASRCATSAEARATDYVGLVTRAIGFGIDAVIIDLAAIVVVAIVALALSLFNVPARIDTALAAIGAVVFIFWAVAYFVTFWSTTGQTPGARIMRFRVVAPGASRGHIGPRRALVRLGGMVLAAIPLLAGYFIVLVDDRRRGLHDRLARTVVIDASATETPANRMRAQRRAAARRQ